MCTINKTAFALSAAVLASAATTAFGCGALEHKLDAFAAEADLVFRGVVSDIEYVLSEPSGDDSRRTPYTFVTYRVDDVLSGQQPGATVTLRFIGGLDFEALEYMQASNVPQFDVADEDILFVKDNTLAFSPLVDDIDGRLRIIGGQVFSETGRAVKVAEDGSFSFGKRSLLPDVLTTNVMGRIFEEDVADDAITGPADASTAEAVSKAIRRLAVAGPARPFLNANASLPFDGPDMTPAPPPADLLGPAPLEDIETRQERELAEALAPAVVPVRK